MKLIGEVVEAVLAKPQSEKKFDVACSPSSAPNTNFIPPYGGFPVNPFGQVAPGYGAAAGFQQSATWGTDAASPTSEEDRGSGTGRGVTTGSGDDNSRYRL
ncbi:hypothetical protein ACH5RR_024235 [Cinchona calisaya]|uniref:Uncharacterized protein n=1 Tax=Cinchona calisaya TaxID=153742 RepID=A0ABD2ZD13_9GENT